jgi:hypothetical protein
MQIQKFLVVSAVCTLLGIDSTFAQIDMSGRQNVITTAVPFLMITPDSRAGGMGDVGVATKPDANSIHWNPAKLAFVDAPFGISLSYTPWLQAIVPDMSISYLSGFRKIDEFQSVGASLKYFSFGDISFMDQLGFPLGEHRPYEFAIDGAYARKLSDYFSIGLGLRFIYSDLTKGLTMGTVETKAGTSISGDISAYYQRETELFGYNGMLSFGGNISNIGNKITYTSESVRDFIPINLRIGTNVRLDLDEYNQMNFAVDLNKLLVPSAPVVVFDADGNRVIVGGEDPDVPVMQGIFQSFSDAPGGFKEEMREINPSVGIEYWYDKQFAGRAGYFYEHPTKGNRQYLTLGIGVRYNVFGIDFAYLVPTNSNKATNSISPLENTLRFSLLFNFADNDTRGR